MAAMAFSSSSVHAFAPYKTGGLDRRRVLYSQAVPQSVPLQFDDALLDDMQNVLLALEKRVKEGDGSLSLLEVEEMDTQLNRIIAEMKVNQNKQIELPPPEEQSINVPRINVPPPTKASVSAVTESPPVSVTDISLDEGPEYDGTGGMGQPRGTVNTYIIEGMDEMSPEEYRDALQKSIIDRQKTRRATGVVGNRSTWNYLNNLTGETGVLKDEKK